MSLSTSEIISGAALLLAIGSALWQRYGVILDLKKEQGTMALSFEEKLGKMKDKYSNELSEFKDSIQNHFTSQGDSFYGELGKLSVQLVTIDNRMTKQEMKMDLFWGAVQDTVKDMLKQPVHLRKDELLDKFPNLDYNELCELRAMLTEEKGVLITMTKQLSPTKKVYLISLALMLAGIDSRLIDVGRKC